MRIGEIAELIGVSARAVRHYHQVGLLPEPERQANGYRVYGLRDAVRLARVRRLTALGLSLGEVRDVLAGEAGRDLAGALAELDADLARQEAEIRDRRARLAVLLRQAAEGELSGDAPLSPELTELLREQEWAPAASEPGSKMAARDRELFVLLDTTAPELVRGRLLELVRAVGSGPEGADRARSAYALLDGLADASPDDPAVRRAAQAVADCVPDEVAALMAAPGPLPGLDAETDGGLGAALLADLPPAQAAAVRGAVALLAARVEAP